MRKLTEIRLTIAEGMEFENLRPIPGEAWEFWKRVGIRLGVDFTRPMRLMRLDLVTFAVL